MSTSKLPFALLLGLGALSLALPAQANQAPEVRGHSETIGAGRNHAGWIWARDAEGDRITFAITRQAKQGTITRSNAPTRRRPHPRAALRQRDRAGAKLRPPYQKGESSWDCSAKS